MSICNIRLSRPVRGRRLPRSRALPEQSLAPQPGEPSVRLRKLASSSAQGLVMKYSRSDEAQADAVGAIILCKSGYNPQAMADFSNKLAAQGSAGPQFFSDHPNPGNRQAAIQKQIAAWLPETYSSNDAVFKVARQQALGVKAYSAEEIAQGAKANQWAKLNHQNGAIVKPPAEAAISSASLVSPATAEGKAEPIGLQRVL